ncbi:sugar ABC transporter permease [Demequina sp. TTPB684]|uniref:carbohydrate ABC transporter permease n=1 Tax=unclassified Demequina TaxID=2620311 RepID=UPI001CF552D1|nr:MULTISPECIES: sugar ABC transporter permease [unclassified Demequina]MCB2413974.1 sugar ABC transporter permease [Demequina sp. TTPB684]UPU88672.1 sugar ABC transporter permease [Demequina sp. TMPB413]
MSTTSAPQDGGSQGAVRQRQTKLTWRQRRGQWDVKYSPYLYIAPFFIVFGITGLFPILYTAYISLQDWDLVRNTGEFIGFDQFAWVLQDREFWIALRNTFSIFLLSSVPQLVAATFIAAMLDANLRAKTFWRMGVLLPYVVAPVAVALIFSNMFGDKFGLINTVLGDLGIDPILWHTDIIPSHFAIATMVNFRWTGYNALILLAAMQAIPRDLYEAAAIDGARTVRRFFSITIPQIRPTMIFVIITATIGGLQIFDEPRMYDAFGLGGANRQWLTITMYLYNTGWGDFNFGRAAAVAWLLFLIIISITLLNNFLTRKFVADDATAVKKVKKQALKGSAKGGK